MIDGDQILRHLCHGYSNLKISRRVGQTVFITAGRHADQR